MINLTKINKIIDLLEKKDFIVYINDKILYIKKIEGDTVKQHAELIEILSLMVVDPEFIAEEIEKLFN